MWAVLQLEECREADPVLVPVARRQQHPHPRRGAAPPGPGQRRAGPQLLRQRRGGRQPRHAAVGVQLQQLGGGRGRGQGPEAGAGHGRAQAALGEDSQCNFLNINQIGFELRRTISQLSQYREQVVP